MFQVLLDVLPIDIIESWATSWPARGLYEAVVTSIAASKGSALFV